MKEYFTDSIYFKKKNKDFKFYANEIFKWKIIETENGLEYRKNDKFENISEITALVSPSNYRLIFDILNIDSNANLYAPEYNKDGFFNKYNVNKDLIRNEFDKYMKRSYISYLSYNSLKSIGLKRIEQYLILLISLSFSNNKFYDNLFVPSSQLIVKNYRKDKKETILNDKKVDLINFIYAVSNNLNYEFIDVFSFILKLYAELKCSDPFSKNGIEFFEDSNEIYLLYKEIIETEVLINKGLLETDKLKFIIKSPLYKYSKLLEDYYLLQKEDYFKDKIIYSEVVAPNIIDIIKFSIKIIPLKDTLLTIQLLDKMKKISIVDFNINIGLSLKRRIKVRDNKEWVSLKVWENIYNNSDFIFNEIIEPIDIEKITFECPICKNNVYSVTPQKLFCSKKECDFSFYRTNLRDIGIKRVSVENIIEGLKNETILINKDDNSENISVFIKNNDSFYSFWIK